MPDSTSATMETGTTSWTDSVTEVGEGTLRSADGIIGVVAREVWGVFHRHPNLGALISGGVGLGGAMLVGVAELAVTLVATYIGYRVFAYGDSLGEAFQKSIELREGKPHDEKIKEPTLHT